MQPQGNFKYFSTTNEQSTELRYENLTNEYPHGWRILEVKDFQAIFQKSLDREIFFIFLYERFE